MGASVVLSGQLSLGQERSPSLSQSQSLQHVTILHAVCHFPFLERNLKKGQQEQLLRSQKSFPGAKTASSAINQLANAC